MGRLLTSIGIVIALVVVVLLFTGGSSYVLNVHFLDAGGLVTGGRVEIAGLPVGSISAIRLTPDGEADIVLSLDGAAAPPLHYGTRAYIRAVGLAGVDNNYVLLTPGPSSAAALPSGSVLSTNQTSGYVPLDSMLDAFGPPQRKSLDALISESNQIYAGSGARSFNRMLAELDPALGQLEGYTGSLALDRGEISELVRTGSAAASAVASRSDDLTNAVEHTAAALSTVAGQRRVLADLLQRTPGVLDDARVTLSDTGPALLALRPGLKALVPVAPLLGGDLNQVQVVLPGAASATSQLDGELPSLDRSLTGLVPLRHPAVRALETLGTTMKTLYPIAKGVRYYGTDLVLGVLSGLLGVVTSEYDRYGHYAKANFVETLNTLVTGPLANFLTAHPLPGGVFGGLTGDTRRCPGGNEPPAPDGSSPWNLGSKYCSASEDIPLSVDFK